MASATASALPARRPGPLLLASLGYLAVVSGLMIWRGISVTPDYLLVLLVPVAVLSGRWIRFLRDWVPFVVILLAWEAMRGLAPNLGIAPNISGPARIEMFLFGGHLPTDVLQSMARGPGMQILAVIATVVYFAHFLFPIMVGLLLWLWDRTQFIRFTTALTGMAMAGFVVFLLLPTAPPWYALNSGVLHGFQKLLTGTLPSSLSPYYASLNPNPVAAFPSLHAAFPFLGYLAVRPVFPRLARVMLGWCGLVWLSIVFLGEHYVIDVVGGVALASASWAVLMRWCVPRIRLLRPA